jgi:hypothetical protein
MSEGPVSFGKPLLYLVIAGCIGGGVYLYTHWPVSYEAHDGVATWSIDFPHGWEVSPANDPAVPSKIIAKGPLKEEIPGAAWVCIVPHGTLDWPGLAIRSLGGTVDTQEDTEIAHKKALIVEFEDANTRWEGVAVQRGDVLIVGCVGCPKTYFAENKPMIDKVIRSVRCTR